MRPVRYFDHDQSSHPPFVLVNKYAYPEVASGVVQRAQAVIDGFAPSEIKVRRIELNGTPYVVVLGSKPDREVRRKLAQIFAVGEPVFEPDQEVEGFFSLV